MEPSPVDRREMTKAVNMTHSKIRQVADVTVTRRQLRDVYLANEAARGEMKRVAEEISHTLVNLSWLEGWGRVSAELKKKVLEEVLGLVRELQEFTGNYKIHKKLIEESSSEALAEVRIEEPITTASLIQVRVTVDVSKRRHGIGRVSERSCHSDTIPLFITPLDFCNSSYERLLLQFTTSFVIRSFYGTSRALRCAL